VLREAKSQADKKRAKEAPRTCMSCAIAKPVKQFTKTQWHGKPQRRKCMECQEVAREAEAQKAREAEEQKAREAEAQEEPQEEPQEDPRKDECPVCFEHTAGADRRCFECMHWLCKGCMSHMYAAKVTKRCPMCRHHQQNVKRLVQ